MKAIPILLAAALLASCGSIPIPDQLGGGSIETTPVYHDPTSEDNRRENPKAIYGGFTRRVPPSAKGGLDW